MRYARFNDCNIYLTYKGSNTMNKRKMIKTYTLIIDDCLWKENECSCGAIQGGWSIGEAEVEFEKHKCLKL